MIPPITPEELEALAQGIFSNQVFTSRHLLTNDMEMISSVFLPITFLDEKQWEELKSDRPGEIYEWLKEAGPRSVNGYPVFMSFRMLTEADAETVWTRVEQIRELLKATAPKSEPVQPVN